ncbi:MAG TPA: hypothetical protein VFE50_22360 [Cyclobacteriaceae bacterium]|nr:hypothetical protein [Cyclobacteriaceae bacterium]
MKESNQPLLLRVRYLFALSAMLISLAASGQNDPNDGREMVMYDPLFWKDELALRNNQSRKIEEINTEFYESIRLMKDENVDESNKHEQLEQGLRQRSRKIYDALMPKQRRKLEKIIDKTAPVAAP